MTLTMYKQLYPVGCRVSTIESGDIYYTVMGYYANNCIILATARGLITNHYTHIKDVLEWEE